MDRLASMEAFALVVETRSFSEAARRLRQSKSLISRQVASLEAELGVRLLQRTTRSLTLTEAGRHYHEQLHQILERIDDAALSISQLQATPRGRLRISAPVSFGALHLGPALPDFLSEFPEIELDISLNDRLVDMVEEGFDLAIRVGRLTDSSLIARKIAPSRRILSASPAYLGKYGTPATPDDLKNHHCLCYSNLTKSEEWRFQTKAGKNWAVEVRGRLHANNGDLLRQACLSGAGLAYLPSFFIGCDLQAGTLVSVLADYIPQDYGIFAVYPNARLLSPKVRSFVDFLTERFGPNPQWDLIL